MYLPGRERKVIEFLLNAKEAITIKEIAKALGVSDRTIHRDIKSVEKLMADYNLKLKKKAGVGLQIIGDKRDKQKLERLLANVASSNFTSDERQAVILSTLFDTNEPIKLHALASELKVTVATISNDLDQMEEELADYQLQLIRKRGYGVKVEGDEGDKRAAISNLISKYVDPFDYISLLKESIQKKSQQQLNTISNRLLGLVNPENLNVIEKRVELVREELPHELADSAYIGLVVHLSLAIERLQKGDKITFDKVYMKQIQGTKEFEIASNMIKDLEVSLSMDIPDDEIGYITMHLMGAKLRINQHYLMEDSSLDIAYKARELIQYVSTQLDTDLSDDAPLLNDLVAHLKPTIYRLKQDMNIKNPLIEEITRDYSDLFYLIRKGVRDLFPDMEFPDDEIGYLVLHFAAILLTSEIRTDLHALVICSSGIGTAKILATRLMQRVPEIKQVDNKSMFDLEDIHTDSYDIIVSTISLTGFDGDYIHASPMLTQSEIHRIKKLIRQKRLNFKPEKSPVKSKQAKVHNDNFIPKLEAMQNYSKAILSLLNSFHMTQITEKKSLESILSMACNELKKGKWLTNSENVFKKLLKREQISGLGIPDTSLALYHTRSAGVYKPSFSIYSLSHPLTIKGMDGENMKMNTIVLMLAPEVTHQEVLEALSFLSSLIIQGQESIKLFESGNESHIKQFLSEQFQKFLQEKNIII
ncbi:transcriptional antiterminator [Virgibacillus profundi]|uniref:Transcriptional antiterminator n=1 Tax=Virgibacillus profundi TaxID=2024555 RepID=A0A2A2IIR6_9BACI|nr:transcriptional antiterminator [Virgibacillus profundi]PXY55463.1 PRD domain-containing protein [Virgibacillus profundi]